MYANKQRSRFFRQLWTIGLCVWGTVASRAWSQQRVLPVMSVRLDSSRILIGDQAHLELRLQADPSRFRIQWPVVPDSVNHLLILQRSPLDTLKTAAGPVLSQRITLTSFDSGAWILPSLPYVLRARGDTSAPATLQTDSLLLQVQTVPVDTSKAFQPIKDIIRVPFNLWDYWPYIALALLVLLLLAWVLYLRRRKKRRPVSQSGLSQDPPYQLALEALRSLEQQQLWKQDVKSYYSTLSDILRTYLERQHNLPAMEQTTEELLSSLKPHTRLNQQRSALEHILRTADLAKFAKGMPEADEHARCMQQARDFVTWTRPREQAETTESESPKPADSEPVDRTGANQS